MPKEYVYDKDGEQLTSDSPKMFKLRVGWNKESGLVQVATVDEDAPLGSVESGLYVDLDRDGLNRAIRIFRQARDDCYGKDE